MRACVVGRGSFAIMRVAQSKWKRNCMQCTICHNRQWKFLIHFVAIVKRHETRVAALCSSHSWTWRRIVTCVQAIVCVRAPRAYSHTAHTRTHINFTIRCSNIMQWHRYAALAFIKQSSALFFSLRVIKLRLRRIQPETRERGVFALLCVFIHSIRCGMAIL